MTTISNSTDYAINANKPEKEVKKMPRGDRTGPLGFGPMTGRGMGYCSGYPYPGFMSPGFGSGFGRGFGMGRSFGRGFGSWGYPYPPMTPYGFPSAAPFSHPFPYSYGYPFSPGGYSFPGPDQPKQKK
jgi:hypothetical protein